MIYEELKNIKESKKDLRKFGVTVGLVLIIIAFLLYWKQNEIYLYFGWIGLSLTFAGLAVPNLLKPINKIWMTFAILMGWVMTRVILIILFFVILTPIGILSKIFRKDFLKLKKDELKESYWEVREKTKLSPEDYEKQF